MSNFEWSDFFKVGKKLKNGDEASKRTAISSSKCQQAHYKKLVRSLLCLDERISKRKTTFAKTGSAWSTKESDTY